MDAISAGASVVAFITLGLQSAKVIYETLSAIRDGPKSLQQVISDVEQIQSILKHLLQSPATANNAPLTNHVSSCVLDLELAASEIQKLQISPNQQGHEKLWRRVKTFLNEKDLDRISAQIARHANTLSLRLNIMTSHTAQELKDINVETHRRFEASAEILQAQAQLQTMSLNDTAETLTTLRTDIRNGLSLMQNTVGAPSPPVPVETSVILEQLNELKAMLTGFASLSMRPTEGGPGDSLRGEGWNPKQSLSGVQQNHQNPSVDVVLSITRLCNLLHETGTDFDSYNDANCGSDTIVQDLQTVLDFARKSGFAPQHIQDGVPSTCDTQTAERDFQNKLWRFGRTFGQFELSINEEAPRKQSLPHNAFQQTYSYDKVDIGIGKLSLMNKKRVRKLSAPEDSDNRPKKRGRADYMTTFSFMPDDTKRFHMLVASTFQQERATSTIFSFSRLSVNRVIPARSRVFTVVREGLLQELLKMLREGEASLRDHDEYGASLLMYSTTQPEICKFLIANGADVDHVAGTTGIVDYGSSEAQPALRIETNDFEMRTDELLAANHCRRLLLEAGADPLLCVDPKVGSFLHSLCDVGTYVGVSLSIVTKTIGLTVAQESIRLAWNPDLTGHFVQLNEFISEDGRPIFLEVCRSAHRTLKVAEALLDLGADIHVRDEQGDSCLAHFIMSRKTYFRARVDHDTLKFLIDRGADLHSRGYDGSSVSQLAYLQEYQPNSALGGYRGDLWDSVLHHCGYNIESFRGNYGRKAWYTEAYTRSHFEELWEGREDCCPYWNDEPWLPEELSEYSSSSCSGLHDGNGEKSEVKDEDEDMKDNQSSDSIGEDSDDTDEDEGNCMDRDGYDWQDDIFGCY